MTNAAASQIGLCFPTPVRIAPTVAYPKYSGAIEGNIELVRPVVGRVGQDHTFRRGALAIDSGPLVYAPPLRSETDRQACLAAVADGTIDVLCSAHDPRGPEAKRLPFADAEPGMAGAETLLALGLGLVRDGVIALPRLMATISLPICRTSINMAR